MRRLIILGNCVAQRLAQLLGPILDRYNPNVPPRRRWELVPAPPVYNLPAFSTSPKELAGIVRQCDLVFTQPLFNFGALNTDALKCLPGISLHTFSAPNFDAYFPDLLHPPRMEHADNFPPPLEWHSKIFLECKAANVPVEHVEKLYPVHPVFRPSNMAKNIEKAWFVYEQREKGVEISTLETCRRFYATEPLFFTWKHPGDRIISVLLKGMLARLGLDSSEIEKGIGLIRFCERPDQPHIWSDWGFGFNAWPILNNTHKIFSFPERKFFRIAGKEIDILTAAVAWYHYYDKNPHIFSSLLQSMSA